ncbi:hypothetical protein [Galbibacter sp.]|uniref:hypothetical protein n=1 Tax=Galbibacter sp. TaxID=2918471 RepID=UPI002CFE1B8A|nr:hypothetical protein [Galbibacter sp.]HLV63610.1 hypothetical protein [Galbibacter sp.]
MNTDTTTKGNPENLDKFHEQMEKEKEDRLIDLIIEIIVNSTMREYYESIDSKDKPAPNNKIDE